MITRGEDEVGLDVTQITCDVWSFDAAVAEGVRAVFESLVSLDDPICRS